MRVSFTLRTGKSASLATLSWSHTLKPVLVHKAGGCTFLRSRVHCYASRGVMTATLISPSWLHSRLHDKDIKVLDGTWYLPNAGKGNPKTQFKQDRIPGSSFFDMDNIADKSSSLPHMLPTEQAFAAAADALGIASSTQVVVYDRLGIFSAARVWWTFKVFGHDRIAVLDGGLPLWLQEGYELESNPVSDANVEAPLHAAQQPPATCKYHACLQKEQVRSLDQVLQNIDQQKELVIDARGAGRFQGSSPEPRAGMRGGHIPYSKNVPFDTVLTNGRLKTPQELQSVFKSAGVDLQQPLVTSCGTGVTASVLALALAQLKPSPKVAVYDGSWSEWGSREDTPIETGS